MLGKSVAIEQVSNNVISGWITIKGKYSLPKIAVYKNGVLLGSTIAITERDDVKGLRGITALQFNIVFNQPTTLNKDAQLLFFINDKYNPALTYFFKYFLNRKKLLSTSNEESFYNAKALSNSLKGLCKHKKTILYIDDCVPQESLGKGYPRALQIIKVLAKQYNVIIYPINKSLSEVSKSNFSPSVIVLEAEKLFTGEQLNQLCQNIDIIWVSRPHNFQQVVIRGWFHYLKQAGVPIIYDAEALFSERERLKAMVMGHNFHESTQNNEIRLLQLADAIATVSSKEQEKIKQFCCCPVSVVGHFKSVVDIEKSENLNEVLFVGNLTGSAESSPNVDSINFFIDTYLPQLRANNFTLRLVGQIDELNRQRWQQDGVEIEGMVEELEPFYKLAFCTIAPTRFAAGIPLKCIESLSYKTPFIATALILDQCNLKPKTTNGLLTPDCFNIKPEKRHSIAIQLVNRQSKSLQYESNKTYFEQNILLLCSNVWA